MVPHNPKEDRALKYLVGKPYAQVTLMLGQGVGYNRKRGLRVLGTN